jgi:hypothetical protein
VMLGEIIGHRRIVGSLILIVDSKSQRKCSVWNSIDMHHEPEPVKWKPTTLVSNTLVPPASPVFAALTQQ